MSKQRVRADRPLSRDVNTVYRTYVSQCRRLGLKPAPPERARKQIKAWVAELAAGQTEPPPTSSHSPPRRPS